MKEVQENETQSWKIFGIIVTILFLLSAFFAWQNWSKNKILLAEKQRDEVRIDSLVAVRNKLQTELDELEKSFADLSAENQELEGKVAASASMLAQKQAEVKKIKLIQSKNESELRAQIAALQRSKTEMETVIAMLRSENETLKAENVQLRTENATLKGTTEKLSAERDDLAKQLAEQIKKTHSAKFKATSFRVELEKRRNKLTTKARKVREINISFDLADVPKEFQGEQKIYLVITDDKGVPIKTQNPIKATVYAPAGDVEILAAKMRPVNLGDTQRLAFTQEIDERLKRGNYVVAVYCDKGLLGASSFRLD